MDEDDEFEEFREDGWADADAVGGGGCVCAPRAAAPPRAAARRIYSSRRAPFFSTRLLRRRASSLRVARRPDEWASDWDDDAETNAAESDFDAVLRAELARAAAAAAAAAAAGGGGAATAAPSAGAMATG